MAKSQCLKDRKRSLQKLSASKKEFKTSENKTLSRRTITRRLFNAGFVCWRCVKKPLLSQKNIRQNEVVGRIWKVWFRELCGVMNQEFSCMLTSREVCSKIWGEIQLWMHLPQLSMDEEVSWCGEPFQLLVLVSCFTVKSKLMLWN